MKDSSRVLGLFRAGIFSATGLATPVGQVLGFASGGTLVLSFFDNSTAATRTIVRLGSRSKNGQGFVVIRLPRGASRGDRTFGTNCGGVYRVNGREVEETNGGVGRRSPSAARSLSANFHILGLSSAGVRSVCCSPGSVSRTSLFSRISGIGPSEANRSLLFRMVLRLNTALSSGVRAAAMTNGAVCGITRKCLITYFSPSMASRIMGTVTRVRPTCTILHSADVGSSSATAGFRRVFGACSPSAMAEVL